MRNHTITLRLSNEEHSKLEQDAGSVQMTTSQYIRALILNHKLTPNRNQREIATRICKLYIMLKEREMDPDDFLMEEINRLCQILY